MAKEEDECTKEEEDKGFYCSLVLIHIKFASNFVLYLQ